MGALRRAVVEGDTASGSLMAGQSVGLVKESQSIQEIFDELLRDIEDELRIVRENLVSRPLDL